MPNWVTNRLTLSGPPAEIDRFKSTCIETRNRDDRSETHFDFNCLVPMPPEIAATFDDQNSPQLKAAAAEATGFDHWYDWSNHHWGVKWNASHCHLIASTKTTLDFRFDTPWAVPDPIFKTLAQQFVDLSGVLLAVDESGDWGAAGRIDSGSYFKGGLHPSSELFFIVYEATGERYIAEISSQAISSVSRQLAGPATSASLCNGPKALLDCTWQSICDLMPEDFAPRFYFYHDIQGYLSWLESDADGEWEDASASRHALDKFVRNASIREFLFSLDRSATEIDQQLLGALAECTAFSHTLAGDQYRIAFGEIARVIALEANEEALREWATRAVFRSHRNIAMQSCDDLRSSFIEEAFDTFDEIEAFLTAAISQGQFIPQENREAAMGSYDSLWTNEAILSTDMVTVIALIDAAIHGLTSPRRQVGCCP
ncbi:hypothetical protein KBI52_04520 [Microvirga sp. HBU67558]|uniref:DUF1281 family ferredoxin-like fold protein n=1 Tax=Microvirga TaxID=186650 RepID=UPI001B38BE4A|nr:MULTISPECIES: hypothetical protein [unclassified Microvirga]MBQ0819487.1 hypothetical protein [Microvirga sp. HBU67558]